MSAMASVIWSMDCCNCSLFIIKTPLSFSRLSEPLNHSMTNVYDFVNTFSQNEPFDLYACDVPLMKEVDSGRFGHVMCAIRAVCYRVSWVVGSCVGRKWKGGGYLTKRGLHMRVRVAIV